jgi:hypothetical protein
MESIVRMFPLLCNRLGTVTSKIVKITKLLEDGLAIEFEPYRIPFNSTLPVVAVGALVLAPLKHNASSAHA